MAPRTALEQKCLKEIPACESWQKCLKEIPAKHVHLFEWQKCLKEIPACESV